MAKISQQHSLDLVGVRGLQLTSELKKKNGDIRRGRTGQKGGRQPGEVVKGDQGQK